MAELTDQARLTLNNVTAYLDVLSQQNVRMVCELLRFAAENTA